MPCGDLLGYVRKCRAVRDRYYLGDGRAQDLTNYNLVIFAKQIAAGMVFLGSRGGCLPIKWTAPEILLGYLAALSTLSDVFISDMFSNITCTHPYALSGGISYHGWSEGRVVAEVTKGYQMPKPDHVDKELHDMTKRCWNLNPDFRPRFENLRQRMDKFLREETYVELLNLGAYDKKKYYRVEDLGDKDPGP
ncbi:proto-oncogene tyrosine-protein kinase LCK-like, partial [Stylophora pistillata]|uniref:proto-oncogene tyrosine-protein kinase LCK-like n=1 Tax=Stylophora pistillata TaxID=50429 RepID=UPI000C040B71